MKIRNRIRAAFWVALLVMMATSGGCKKKTPEPDARTLQLQKLSSTWKVQSVVNDDLDITSQYTGFALMINELNYTTQNGGNPWPSSGKYDFKDDNLNVIVRNDGTEVSIDEITDASLVLSFNFNNLTGGRVNGVTGDFTFSLIK